MTVGARRVSVARLVLHDFRCYAHARVETDESTVVVHGANGAGKTTLLEAISLLSPGRGLRRSRLEDLKRHAACRVETPAGGGWAVSARLRTAAGPVEVGTGTVPQANGIERRQVRVDGAPARGQSALASLLSVLWLVPEMDRLFTDSASGRRRFLDRTVYGFDPAHATRLGVYERSVSERSHVLRGGRADPLWLDAIEDGIARAGVAIAAARKQTVAALARAAARVAAPYPEAGVAVEGTVEGWLDAMPALACEDRLRAVLAENRRIDAIAGGAQVGPHRSDLVVRHGASGRPAPLCSTGEQKMLLIALVLATVRALRDERGVSPLLLLDEVAAHLDERHRQALFDAVSDLDVQAWYAGTDPAVFRPLRGRAQFLHIDAATVTDEVAGPATGDDNRRDAK